MPRYYFDVSNGDRVLPDETGQELPDLRAAEDEACRSVLEVSQHRLKAGWAGQVSVQVRDDEGDPILIVTAEPSGPTLH